MFGGKLQLISNYSNTIYLETVHTDSDSSDDSNIILIMNGINAIKNYTDYI